MKTANIYRGFINFLDKEIIPKATDTEKIAITAASGLGILEALLMEKVNSLLANPVLSSSKLWLDDAKTEIDDCVLAEVCEKSFSVVGKEKLVFKGWPLDFGFYKLNLLEGYVITPQLIRSLFDEIKAV